MTAETGLIWGLLVIIAFLLGMGTPSPFRQSKELGELLSLVRKLASHHPSLSRDADSAGHTDRPPDDT